MEQQHVESLLAMVRAGFGPKASVEARRKAAHGCRMLLVALDPGGAQARSEPPREPPRQSAQVPPVPDPMGMILDAIIARFKPLVPEEEWARGASSNPIPFVDFASYRR